jgi:hypothetical protein
VADALAALVGALPGVLFLLDAAAAVAYALDADAGRAIYWLAAAVLTAVVTF